MIGLSTTRIKEGAIHFESNLLNDSSVEFISSLMIAERSWYKNHLFFTLSSCTLNKTRQDKKNPRKLRAFETTAWEAETISQ